MWLTRTAIKQGAHIDAYFKPRAIYGNTISNDESTKDFQFYILTITDETTKRKIIAELDLFFYPILFIRVEK